MDSLTPSARGTDADRMDPLLLLAEAVAQRVVARAAGVRAPPVIERCHLAIVELPILQMSIALAQI
jgi:hypothetical protein